MIGLKRLWAPHKLVRQAMATEDAGFAAVEQNIRNAHFNYLVGPRSPVGLKPIGIPEITADWIRKKYKSAPKSLHLDWITSARNDHDLVICPMCGGTSVATLDHVLPKANYPEFSVLSFNLVPSCDGCQRRRSNKGALYEFIHPYFDHALLESLRLVVSFTPPYGSVLFKLHPQGLSGIDLQRTQRHLDECLPPLLFRRHMRRLWGKWHTRIYGAKLNESQQRLNEELTESEQDVLNSWDSAFLRGLSQDAQAANWMNVTPR